MEFRFKQFEVEQLLRDALKSGTIRKIADKLDRKEGYIGQMCNPDDERKSDFYKAIQFIAAILDTDQEQGRAALQLFNLMCERHIEWGESCSTTATVKFLNEHKEFFEAKMTGKSLDVVIKELDDVIQAAQCLKQAKQRGMAQQQFPK